MFNSRIITQPGKGTGQGGGSHSRSPWGLLTTFQLRQQLAQTRNGQKCEEGGTQTGQACAELRGTSSWGYTMQEIARAECQGHQQLQSGP